MPCDRVTLYIMAEKQAYLKGGSARIHKIRRPNSANYAF